MPGSLWGRMTRAVFGVINYPVHIDDEEIVKLRKRLMLLLGLAGGVVSWGLAPIGIEEFDLLRVLAYSWGAFLSLACVTFLIVTKRAPEMFCELIFYGAGVVFLLLDLNGVVNEVGRFRGWPLFIVLIDLCIVLEVRERIPRNIVLFVLFWLVYVEVELQVGTGFFDNEEFFTTFGERRQKGLDCEKPPCGSSWRSALSEIAAVCYVFLLDFYFTRRFAHEARDEKNRMKSVINASEKIAKSLSKFDLISAEHIIRDSPLPTDLETAYQDILRNLKEYRPYLPLSCLQSDGQENSIGETEDEICRYGGVMVREQPDHPNQLRTSCTGDDFSSQHSMTPRSKSTSILGVSVEKQVVHNMNPLAGPLHVTGVLSQINVMVAKRSATFTVLNLLNTHAMVEVDLGMYEVKFARFLSSVAEQFAKHKGVLGVVQGDHVHGSFNAMKRCGSHCISGLRAVRGVVWSVQSEISAGVSTGQAYCGTFGNDDVKAYAALSPAVITASTAERVAKNEAVHATCTDGVAQSAGDLFILKIILSYQTPLLYNVHFGDPAATAPPAEWMYELPKNPWVLYNSMARKHLLGHTADAVKTLESLQSLSADEEELLDVMANRRGSLSQGLRSQEVIPEEQAPDAGMPVA